MGYPVNLNLARKPVLVVGGGLVALRKVRGLLEAGARITVVAPSVCQEIGLLHEEGELSLLRRAYQPDDLEGKHLAIAATSDEAVNAQVFHDAGCARIPVNVVDRPELCSFAVPAVMWRGDLSISVATEGRCPTLAQILREELEDRYGESYAGALALLGGLRRVLIAQRWDDARIRASLRAVYFRGIVRCVASGEREALRSILESEVGEGLAAEVLIP